MRQKVVSIEDHTVSPFHDRDSGRTEGYLADVDCPRIREIIAHLETAKNEWIKQGRSARRSRTSRPPTELGYRAAFPLTDVKP
jgi:hypothetical protein